MTANIPTITLEKDSIHIDFEYDPELVYAVKQIGHGRKWNGKTWEVKPQPGLGDELHIFCEYSGAKIPKEIQKRLHFEDTKEESNLSLSVADAPTQKLKLPKNLYPFQKAGIEYIVKNGNVLLADDMGLGKTVQALWSMELRRAYPLLIICPASLKWNWYNEIKKWLPGRGVEVLGAGMTPHDSYDNNIFIINYESLGKFKFIFALAWAGLIVDESHYIKNYKAQRTKEVQEIANMSHNVLLLSGTPVLNKPKDLVPQLLALKRLNEFGGFWEFMKKYCDAHQETIYVRGGGRKTIWNMNGAENLNELNRTLRSTCMVRREKSAVLKDLPDKTRTALPVTISNWSEYQSAEADFIEHLRTKAGDEKAERAKRAEALVKIGYMRKLAAIGKLNSASEFIQDVLDQGQKILVFAWHEEVIELLSDEFRCDAITGRTPEHIRPEVVKRFQDDETSRVLVLNIQAGGLGLTLTAASIVLFVEFAWTPGLMDQAEDRAHRIGQKGAVNVYWMTGNGTIDEPIVQLIKHKREIVDSSTDGDYEYIRQYFEGRLKK